MIYSVYFLLVKLGRFELLDEEGKVIKMVNVFIFNGGPFFGYYEAYSGGPIIMKFLIKTETPEPTITKLNFDDGKVITFKNNYTLFNQATSLLRSCSKNYIAKLENLKELHARYV